MIMMMIHICTGHPGLLVSLLFLNQNDTFADPISSDWPVDRVVVLNALQRHLRRDFCVIYRRGRNWRIHGPVRAALDGRRWCPKDCMGCLHMYRSGQEWLNRSQHPCRVDCRILIKTPSFEVDILFCLSRGKINQESTLIKVSNHTSPLLPATVKRHPPRQVTELYPLTNPFNPKMQLTGSFSATSGAPV